MYKNGLIVHVYSSVSLFANTHGTITTAKEIATCNTSYSFLVSLCMGVFLCVCVCVCVIRTLNKRSMLLNSKVHNTASLHAGTMLYRSLTHSHVAGSKLYTH